MSETQYPRQLEDAITEIRSATPAHMQFLCRRHRTLFAVFPSALNSIPEAARNILLSFPVEEVDPNMDTIPVTTPMEIAKFYKR